MKVAIIKTQPVYPNVPFSPDTKYPEYAFQDILSSKNVVYESVRKIFEYLKFDKKNIGTQTWNPLRETIKPGETVLIKPNLVNSKHLEDGDLTSIITHPALIRVVIDYILIALNGRGKIIIADSPERMADFGQIIKKCQLDQILRYYKQNNINIIEIRDLRRERIEYGFDAIIKREKINMDPEGYSLIDLGHESLFAQLSEKILKKLYGADYKRKETIWAHTEGRNVYELGNSALQVDSIISLPKLKTHYRVGTTLNCKGFIGITGNKNYIPHRILGDPSNGGDTYTWPAQTKRGKIYRLLQDSLKDHLLSIAENKFTALLYSSILLAYRKIFSPPPEDINYIGGTWYGENATWRSTVDIAKIVHYADKNGRLNNKPQKKFFSIIDGIISGEGNGPMKCTSKNTGILVGGSNLVAVDFTATKLMGFDPQKVKYLHYFTGTNRNKFNLNILEKEIKIQTNHKPYFSTTQQNFTRKQSLRFKPPDRWVGHLEL